MIKNIIDKLKGPYKKLKTNVVEKDEIYHPRIIALTYDYYNYRPHQCLDVMRNDGAFS